MMKRTTRRTLLSNHELAKATGGVSAVYAYGRQTFGINLTDTRDGGGTGTGGGSSSGGGAGSSW